MKSKFRALVSFCMALCMCFAMSATVFAAEVPTETVSYEAETISSESIQPRIGIAGYKNYYHNGNSYYGEYKISTSSIALPMKQYTFQLGDFEPNTWVVIDIYNSKGQHMQDMSFNVTGNGKWENMSLKSLYYTNGDTYTIKYNVWNGDGSPLTGDDGWIGIWFY